MGAAADVEAAGEDAFGGDTALRAGLHDLPECENAVSDLLCWGLLLRVLFFGEEI